MKASQTFVSTLKEAPADAEIVSQNNEEGAKAVGTRRQIVWRATPLTKDAPTAVLRLK